MDNKINSRGQIALWVFLAVALFFSIIFFLNITDNEAILQPSVGENLNPESYLKRCIHDSALDVMDLMIPRGGFVEPSLYYPYENINVSFICLNNGNYKPCINQYPMFLNTLRAEILKNMKEDIDNCLEEIRKNGEDRNAITEVKIGDIEIEFASESVMIKPDYEIKITDKGQIKVYDDFDIRVYSPIYDLARVAMEIASQESKYCYFEYVGYQILYPKFEIRKTSKTGGVRIYNILHRESNKEMNIAIRGCFIPVGL